MQLFKTSGQEFSCNLTKELKSNESFNCCPWKMALGEHSFQKRDEAHEECGVFVPWKRRWQGFALLSLASSSASLQAPEGGR